MDYDEEEEGGGRRRRGRRKRNGEWQLFWAGHQRFFHQLCCAAKVNGGDEGREEGMEEPCVCFRWLTSTTYSIKHTHTHNNQVPKVVEMAREALEEGKCVVVGLQSTGEATQDAALEAMEVRFAALSDRLCLAGLERRPLVNTTQSNTITPPPPHQQRRHIQDRRGPANEDAEKALSMPRYGLQRVMTRLFPEPRVKPQAVIDRERAEERAARQRRREEVRVPAVVGRAH